MVWKKKTYKFNEINYNYNYFLIIKETLKRLEN